MDKINKILAPTDLSDLSLVGLKRAFTMAAATGAEVIIYHVITHEEVTAYTRIQLESPAAAKRLVPAGALVADRKELLSGFLSENFGGLLSSVKIRAEVEIGIPHKRIVEKAAEEGVDLIVLSTHGRSGLLHLLIGSVTEKVVRRASCPVLSIHPINESERARADAGRDWMAEI